MRPKPGRTAWTTADLACSDEVERLLNGADSPRTYACD